MFPLGTDVHGRREVCRCHNFRIRDYKDGSPFDVEALWPLLAQIREALPPRELPVLDEGDADDFWKPVGELPAPPSSTVPMSQVEAPVDMEIEPGAVEDAEMPGLDFEGDDQMLERVALTQQEAEYLAFLRHDALFTGERFGEVRAGAESVPFEFQIPNHFRTVGHASGGSQGAHG